MSDQPPYVHELAVVEPGAKLGNGTKVWHHAHVRSGAIVGSDTQLGKNTYVDSGATVGDRCKIQNNVSVYAGVHLADEVFVGPSAVFTNDRFPRAQNPDWEITETYVGEGASIGANATIVCGVTIGRWATVAAGSVVTKDIPDHCLVMGNPAKPVGWVCHRGYVVSKSTEKPQEMRCDRCTAWEACNV